MIKTLGAVATLAAVVATGCSTTTARVISTKPAANHHTSTNSPTRTKAGGIVESSATAGGTTYRLVYRHTGCPGPCNPLLQAAPAGTTTWTTLRHVTSGFAASVAAGRSLVVVTVFGHPAGGASDAHASYLISSDRGTTWRTRSDPCGGSGMQEWDTSNLAVSGHSIAALCERRQAPPTYALVISHDAGATFSARQPVAGGAPVGRRWLRQQLSAS